MRFWFKKSYLTQTNKPDIKWWLFNILFNPTNYNFSATQLNPITNNDRRKLFGISIENQIELKVDFCFGFEPFDLGF